MSRQFETFKNEALQLPGIQKVAKSNSSLVQIGNQNGSVNWPGKPANSSIFFRTAVVDYDFIEAMGLYVVDGRAFAKEFNDTNNLVVSRRAVEVMGLENPVGQKISQWGTEGTIVGVVEDFHGRSLHEAIDPIILLCKPEWTSRVFIRFDGSKTAEAVESLQSLYSKYESEYPFDFTFMDDDFEKLYSNEKVIGSLAIGFTSIAIIISGLGLIGLAAYTAERRRKEIGIRKSMGASVTSLISHLSSEFVKLSVIASIIGCPIAYFAAERFLQTYSYRTPLEWSIFIVTALSIILISLVIVIYQVMKAAQTNPVDSLRNE
jgi:ABC-type antimicrobial peptide transport system permease subunit